MKYVPLGIFFTSSVTSEALYLLLISCLPLMSINTTVVGKLVFVNLKFTSDAAGLGYIENITLAPFTVEIPVGETTVKAPDIDDPCIAQS